MFTSGTPYSEDAAGLGFDFSKKLGVLFGFGKVDVEPTEPLIVDLETKNMTNVRNLDKENIDKRIDHGIKDVVTAAVAKKKDFGSDLLPCDKKIRAAQEIRNFSDLASFEVVPMSYNNSDSKRIETKDETTESGKDDQGFGDGRCKGQIETDLEYFVIKTTTAIKSFLGSLVTKLPESEVAIPSHSGCGCPVLIEPSVAVETTENNDTQTEIIVLGELFASALHHGSKILQAGTSFIFREKDILEHTKGNVINYRGYRIHAKGIELFLDSVRAEGSNKYHSKNVRIYFKVGNQTFSKLQKVKVNVNMENKPRNIFIQCDDGKIEIEVPDGVDKNLVTIRKVQDGFIVIEAP